LLLSDVLPLRSSAVLDAFREAVALSWNFGDLRYSPQAVVQLSDTRFAWSDLTGTVTGVQIDGQEVQGWNAAPFTDSTGHTLVVIELAAPLPTGAVITATGTGMVSPRTGALIENPADIIEQIILLSGYAMSANMRQGLTRLRAECAAEGLTIAGRIANTGAYGTLRSTLNEIMRSIGGGWSSDSFWLHPPAQVFTAPPADVEQRLPEAVVSSCVAVRGASFSSVAIAFDDQAYAARHRQALTLAVRPSLSTATLPVALLSGWVRTFASATTIAKRLLRRGSAQVYEVKIDAPAVSPALVIGDVFAHASPKFPAAGLQWLTVLGAQRIGARTEIACELIVPLSGQVFDVVSRTIAGDITQLAGVEVAASNGQATFTVYDGNGKTVVGANVSLDGGTPKRTDSQGKVTFTAAPGEHKLYVEMPGSYPIQLTVNVG